MNDPLPTPVAQSPRIIPRAEHTVSRSQLSPNALRVLYRLKDAGYQAFLVGGCVRDLLIGRKPKDFDVATNALPDEVRQLFRNCRLVGRRFRLAHVVFGREVIEVATFRAASAPPPGAETLSEDSEDGEAGEVDTSIEVDDADIPSQDHTIHRVQNERGRILRDNVYGTVDEDVWRRDFTANALYYNIADFSIWDYCDGAADVTARRLRLIGDPETRYREDPVRMLRAARFEAKLGFDLAPETAEPIARLRNLMADIPPARLFDETLKLFLTGHGEQSFAVLKARGLMEALMPAVGRYLNRYPGGAVERLLAQGLRNTDERVLLDKPVTPSFLFALLLYGPIALAIEALPPQRWHEPAAILDACDRVLREAQQRVALPKRFALGLRDMFALQPRLEQPRGRRALRLLEQPRFRAAYDLLLLRAGVGLASAEVAAWWTRLQEAGPEEQARLCEHLPAQPEGAAAETQMGAGAAAPRRRRRRRRS